ncbi:MAG: hypothetical protein OXH63_20125, partial [Gemmatimonadetes bacterium]|nr:hypothetical protein [Gemmatimonadota bacterium]
MLPPPDHKGLARRTTRQKKRDHNHQYICQTRWQKIQHIVEPRTTPAKTAIARCLKANHRIHRADDLKKHEARQSQEHVVKNRRDKAIHCIFAQTLHARPPTSRHIHPLNIAAHEHCRCLARTVQICGAINGQAVLAQIFERNETVQDKGVKKPTDLRVDAMQHNRQRAYQPHPKRRQNAKQHAPTDVSIQTQAAQHPLKKRQRCTHQANGMQRIDRITHETMILFGPPEETERFENVYQ